jgi:hypothetical protein
MNSASYMKGWLALTVVALGASTANAQWNVARFDSTTMWTYASFGLDPAFVATAGVAGVIPGRSKVQVGAEFGSVVAAFDLRDWRARAAARTTTAHWGSVRITAEEAVIARGTSNSIYSALNLGASATVTAGVYRQRWFAATEGGFDKAVVTRITNSEWYRTYYYADAKDGWYRAPGGTFHAGLTGGVTFGSIELAARAGTLRTERLNAMIPPIYVSLGAGVGWK